MPDSPEATRVELALLARARFSGDRSAFGELVRRHQGAVRAQLRRLAGADHSWADDLAQETFLRAWRKLDQFRGQARFSTWLHCLAYRTFLQAVRRRKAEVRPVVDDHEMAHYESRQHILASDFSKALGRLTEAQQLALFHCYQLDLTHEEAAYVLDVPVGTVKTNIARGKSLLREYLSDWNPDDRARGPE